MLERDGNQFWESQSAIPTTVPFFGGGGDVQQRLPGIGTLPPADRISWCQPADLATSLYESSSLSIVTFYVNISHLPPFFGAKTVPLYELLSWSTGICFFLSYSLHAAFYLLNWTFPCSCCGLHHSVCPREEHMTPASPNAVSLDALHWISWYNN